MTSLNANPVDIQQIFLEQARMICRGGEMLPGGVDQLAKKLQQSAETGMPLRVKLGLDPTRPDLHLGHTVVLRKMRAFQDLGHQAVLIIGDATAMIGDPSGRSATRPPLTEEKVVVNAQTYLDQAGKIIDVRKAEIRRNSEWLNSMNLGEFLKLASQATVAQILAREDFSNRMASQSSIALHELFYPLMQGYDSVVIRSDIELGGTDQRFNNLMGRELQEKAGQSPQMVMLMPLMEGTDGKVKMSKSYPDHCINLTDEPGNMYGKIMSLPDELLPRYEILLGLLDDKQVEEQVKHMQSGSLNPRDVKMHLAKYIVGQYHGAEQGDLAQQDFITRFQKREIPDEMPELVLKAGEAYSLTNLLTENTFSASRNEARRLIQGGGVKLDGEKLTDIEAVIKGIDGTSQVLQSGKRKFLRLIYRI
jgi:tyrosyl-tRNA synthetase